MNRIDAESETFIAHALRAEGFDASENGTGRGTPLVPVAACAPLYYSHDYNQDRIYSADGIAPTHTASDSNRARNFLDGMAVRRLTPTECERLQGFPDGYTNVPYRGKEAADGPRYKALGNSMAVPVLRWILRRILAAEAQCQ